MRQLNAASRSGLLLTLALASCSSTPAGQGDSAVSLADSMLPRESARFDRRSLDASADGRDLACPAIPELLARVNAARMLADLNALTSNERGSQAGQSTAAAYLKQQLEAVGGLNVREQSYTYYGKSYVNLEATLPGELTDRFLFVGAHFDAATGTPGADDDASGTAAVLELARSLAGCRLQRTVRFLLFSNEENSTMGSTKYVQSIASEVPPAKLLGFLSLDMIGYARPQEDLDLASRPLYSALVDNVAASMGKWSSLPLRKVIDDECG